MTRKLILLLAASVLAPACAADSLDTPTPPQSGGTPQGGTAGSEDNTFNHDNDQISPWDLIQRIETEGPPEFTAHVHSCPKVRVRTLGNVLASLGVNMSDATPLSAADLYNSGANALGAPNFANRIRENVSITISGASREFDIFAAAAPEIITNLPNLARCQVAGVGVELFDSNNQCRADGITCLLGEPAQATHLDLCNLSVTNASDVDTGKNIAVASILAAANTC